MALPERINNLRMQIQSNPVSRRAYEDISKYVTQKKMDRLRAAGAVELGLTTSRDDLEFLDEVVKAGVQDVIGKMQSSGFSAGVNFDIIGTQVLLDNHPLGPLFPLLEDEDVQEIRILGHRRCYYFVNDKRYYTELNFQNRIDMNKKVIDYFNRGQAGRGVNFNNPITTLVLPNGSRCHIATDVVCEPPAITIRKHQPEKFPSFQALAKVGGMPEWIVPFLQAAVDARYNMLFAGGVGTGKTTYLRAFGTAVSPDERIGTIEDDRELFLPDLRKDTDTFSLFAKQPNTEGQGGIGMDQLVRDSLRMSADRILVGEVRGKEAFYMLQAMSSGFNGSACTIHAEMAVDAIPQLLRYILQHPDAGRDENLTNQTIGRVIHMIVFLRRIRTGKVGEWKKVLDHILAVHGYDHGKMKTTPLIQYDEQIGDWFWTAPRPSQVGGLAWQTRFKNIGVNPDTLIPQYILSKGSDYARSRPKEGGDVFGSRA